ncbi:uncharacterized protein LOC111996414 [Quercus suber]|uniref:uncharacterized protein LOC111996414 n=1 Tax=Quercus suber TaxID=58331 RepID=UPI0032DF0D4A
MDELKHLSSIESYDLVTQHLHKSVQILAKSMHFTAKYLDIEEKLTFAQAQIMNLDVENTSLKESVKKVTVESVEVRKQLETVWVDPMVERTLSAQKEDHMEKMKKEVEEAMKNFKASKEYSERLMVEYGGD